MTSTLDFAAEKQRLLASLRDLDEALAAAEEVTQVDFGDLRQKIARASSAVAVERFSIALFGAFSDGKTTLAGALLRRTDLRTGPEPCTDDIVELAVGDYLVVDTPGLFPLGLTHEDRTRKYISEANLILFVLPPQNPLKESHREVVTWLLQDLGKLHGTVFVVNKMDEVADVEDDEEFQGSAAILREVVLKTLGRYLQRPTTAAVVCVAADPRQLGLEYWVAHPEEYERLSRIEELRHLMNKAVREARRGLILRAGFDVLREARDNSVERIDGAIRAVNEQLKVSENGRREISEEISELEKDSRDTWDALMKEFENERKRLVLGISAQADAQKLATYILAEIGKDGDELIRRVDRLITTHAEPLAGNARRRMEHIEASISFQKDAQKQVFDTVGKVGVRLAAWLAGQTTRGMADAILRMNRAWRFTRFKPWGAVKVASKFKAVGKILALLGPILDVVSVVIEVLTQRQLTKRKGELTDAVDGLFREVRDELTLPALRIECCPGLEEAREVLRSLAQEQEDYRTVCEKLVVAKQALDAAVLEETADIHGFQ